MKNRILLALAFVTLTGSAVRTSPDARQTFIRDWRGIRVILKRPMHTLVYNEHGRLGFVSRGKREGLTVVSPSAGTWYQFDGRYSEEDIAARDPQRILQEVKRLYRADHPLEIGSFQRIEPVMVALHSPGAQLVVKDVRLDHDRVRLMFADDDADPATMLTVKWPIDLSRSLTERPEIEKLIALFVEVAGS